MSVHEELPVQQHYTQNVLNVSVFCIFRYHRKLTAGVVFRLHFINEGVFLQQLIIQLLYFFPKKKEYRTLYQVAHNMKCRIKRHGQIKLKHTHMCSSYFFFKIEDWKKKKKTNKTGKRVRNRGIKLQSFLHVELFLEKIMIQDVERWRDEETFSIVKVLMILRMYN